jgi:hypothetical protein
MKVSLILIAISSFLFSCGNSINSDSDKNEFRREWTDSNQKKFIDKCTGELDKGLCECILKRIMETGKDVVEIGEMNQNEFLHMAAECNER